MTQNTIVRAHTSARAIGDMTDRNGRALQAKGAKRTEKLQIVDAPTGKSQFMNAPVRHFACECMTSAGGIWHAKA